MIIPFKHRVQELVALLITAFLKFILMDWMNQKLIYISLAIIFWCSYLIYRKNTTKGIFAYWGFNRENALNTFKFLLPFALLALPIFLIVGCYTKQAIFSWHILPILLIYPIWGTIQQFLIMSLFAGNLNDQEKMQIPNYAIILLTALLFGLIHLPYLLLAIGTFLLALIYTYTFLKYRNLWWLGIFHGCIGAFFYYWVLGRDTFLEVFKAI